MKKYYNIHGLLSFSIEGAGRKISHLCKQCEYFLSNTENEKVDIEIHIGPFESIVDGHQEYQVVNRKYCVGIDVIFAEDCYKTARWKVQIEGLDTGRTKFYFDGNGWTKYILHKSFLESLLRYKLNQKGYFMVHSSSVAVGGEGVVFPASPEAGKTSTMLNYLAAGEKFMADDFSLIGNGNIYAYPTPITLHSHNLKRHPFLKDALDVKDKWQIHWRTAVLKLTFGMGDISYKVDIWNKLDGANVEAVAPLSKMVLLTKYSGNDVKVRKVNRKEMVEKLLIVNYYETVLFNGYLKAYYYQNLNGGRKEFWDKMRENVEKILTEDSYDEILLPQRYSLQEFNAVVKAISSK